MGFWDNILGRTVAYFSPQVRYIGVQEAARTVMGDMSPAEMYKMQPALRTVTSFLGRNVAQLGLHVFERVSETDRQRVRGGVASLLSNKPNPTMTAYQLLYATVIDKCLYDRAVWQITRKADGTEELWRIPPSWVSFNAENAFSAKSASIYSSDGRKVDIPMEDLVVFDGYDPSTAFGVSPQIDALKDILREQLEASRFRLDIWQRGGRVSAVIERPAGAPRWSDAARKDFRDDWYAKYTGGGKLAGGTPILEDGMTLRRIDFNAAEQQWVEGVKLSLAQVASAYHVNPTMVGLLDNANFSNVREFRKMLYGETLGPLLRELESVINAFLLPKLGMPDGVYAEFNVAEKLRGSFEEQAAVLSTSVGRPWMTTNEARARQNLPQIEGGDELVTPLNVLVGGQASPRDTGSQNLRAIEGAPRIKAARTTEPKAAEVLRSHIKRQRQFVVSKLGAGGDWWASERFDRELGIDLLKVQLLTATTAAQEALEAAGLDPNDLYDEDRTIEYLKVRSANDAARINAHTQRLIEDALDALEEDAEPLDAVRHTFDVVEGSGVDRIALGMTTAVAAWGVSEAGRQNRAATKTWRVTSSNPRSEHAYLDGETVPMSETFSNGLMWPGDGGDAAEVANCLCELEINF